jgi:hypothetical protein
MNQYAVSMEANPLVAIRADLQRWSGPARMVRGLKDSLFGGGVGWIIRYPVRAVCDESKAQTCFSRRDARADR